MATSGELYTNYVDTARLHFWWGDVDYTNKTVHYKLFMVKESSGYRTIWTYNIWSLGRCIKEENPRTNYYDGDLICEGYTNIDNNGYISFAVNAGIGTSSINAETGTGEWTIPLYAKITAHYVSDTTLNTISVAWATDVTVDWLQYSLNGGAWQNNAGDPYVISGLSPNTTYSIKTKVKRAGTDLWTESDTIYGTTKDIGKISSVSNFNHGDSTTLVTTNPSGSSLNLVMKIGDTQIFSRSVSTGSNTITFSQEELDAIYRLYGSSNSLTATFILTTAGTYTDTKTATITLTGNQKTAHVSQGRCKVYVGVNGEVKQAVIWVGNNGNRRCI